MNLSLSDWESIASIIESGAVFGATIVAVIGFNSWRRETKWKRKYELAEEVLANFYDAKERINIIRSPVGFSSEGSTRIKKENESEEETRRLNNAYVVIERYEREKEPFTNIRKLKHRFLATFGKEHSCPFEEILKIINEILYANYALHSDFRRETYRNEAHASIIVERIQKYESKIWSNYREPDEINNRIDKAIGEIENICVNLLRTRRGKKIKN